MKTEDFVAHIIARYPNLELNSDGDLVGVVLGGIKAKGGYCPCTKKMVPCPCKSAEMTHKGKLNECHCGLFVKKGGSI